MNAIYAFFVFCSILFVSSNAQEERCPLINGIQSECMNLQSCKVLDNALRDRKDLHRDIIRLLRKLHCGFVGRLPKVCCYNGIRLESLLPSQKLTQTTVTTSSTTPVSVETDDRLLPTLDDCGSDLGASKIFDGVDTDIDEFPWMALLGYRRIENNTITFECGGVLINNRYVLTAAHCVTGRITNTIGPLEVVRLGEYDTTTDEDCVFLSNNPADVDCAPPHVELKVEQAIFHPGYDDNNVNRKDDIALIRLASPVTFSFFIDPICLPTTDIEARVNEDLFVAGWGRTLNGNKSDRKQRLVVPLYDKQNCSRLFERSSAILTDNQICAGGRFAQDTCFGDSGGPLMKRFGNNWYSYGIISFGNGCGRDGWPGVYIKTFNYMNWIKRNLRP